MIKKFFITFLGSMAAIWASALLLMALVVVGILAVVSGSDGEKAEVKDGTVLLIDLQGQLYERKEAATLVDVISQDLNSGVALDQTIDCIYRAAHDSRICGIYINCLGLTGGTASLDELGEALRYFEQQPGKWILAYGETYQQGEYFATSGATEVWLNPIGGIDIHGLSATTIFYTGLMEKLGVKMQIMRVGTFKSAVEPYMLKEISPASRLQQESYMGSIWQNVSSTIADNRGLTRGKINDFANDFAFAIPTDSLLTWGLATDLGYRHQVEARVAQLANEDSYNDVHTLTIEQYATTFNADNYSYLPDVSGDDKTIAVLYAVGEISDGGDEGIVSGRIIDQLNKIADDDADNLAGLVLRVNSPGGSAMASEQIWAALEQFKEHTGVPVYVSMGDVAASGGYYISCGADVIYCDSTTITGSIGIFGMIPEIQGLLNNHLGITTSTVSTNRNANFPSLVTPMTAEQLEKMQAYVERGYDLFTKRVAQGRHMSQDSVKAIAEGRVWSGAQALQIGLADRAGSLRTTILALAKDHDISSFKVKTYPEVDSKWWETILTLDDDVMSEKLSENLPDNLPAIQLVSKIRKLQEAPSIQCRMEDVIVK